MLILHKDCYLITELEYEALHICLGSGLNLFENNLTQRIKPGLPADV